MPEYDLSLYENKKMKTDRAVAANALKLAAARLPEIAEWNNENLFESLKALAAENGLKTGRSFTRCALP